MICFDFSPQASRVQLKGMQLRWFFWPAPPWLYRRDHYQGTRVRHCWALRHQGFAETRPRVPGGPTENILRTDFTMSCSRLIPPAFPGYGAKWSGYRWCFGQYCNACQPCPPLQPESSTPELWGFNSGRSHAKMEPAAPEVLIPTSPAIEWYEIGCSPNTTTFRGRADPNSTQSPPGWTRGASSPVELHSAQTSFSWKLAPPGLHTEARIRQPRKGRIWASDSDGRDLLWNSAKILGLFKLDSVPSIQPYTGLCRIQGTASLVSLQPACWTLGWDFDVQPDQRLRTQDHGLLTKPARPQCTVDWTSVPHDRLDAPSIEAGNGQNITNMAKDVRRHIKLTPGDRKNWPRTHSLWRSREGCALPRAAFGPASEQERCGRWARQQ